MAAALSGLAGVPPFEFNTTDLWGLNQKLEAVQEVIWNLCPSLGVTNDAQKRAVLLHMGGQQIQNLFQILPATGDDYKAAVEALSKYFELKKMYPKKDRTFFP